MKENVRIIMKAILKSGVAIACTLLIGLVVDGWDVFRFRSSAFEFVEYGVLGSVFFFSLRANVRDSFAVLFLLFVAQCVLITKSYKSVFFVRDVAFFIMVSVATYVHYAYIYRPRRVARVLEPVLLAALMAVAFVAAVVELHLVRGVLLSIGEMGNMIVRVMQNGFLIGLGIGLGILLVEISGIEKTQRGSVSK